jgi:choline kinase
MTRALILAAGQGTRLRPLTNNKPKCLVPLNGKTLLQRQTETLKGAGIANIHIATGYRADQIVKLGYSTSFNSKFEQTNMVESLFSAMDFIKQEGDLIVAYGDIVYESNNLEELLACDDEISLMIDKNWRELWGLRLENPLDDAETLKINEHGYVTELGRIPKSYSEIEGQYTGLIKIRADKVLDLIAFYHKLDRNALYDGNDFYNMYMTSFLQLMIDEGWKAKAVMVNNGWLEVDSVEDLELYEKMTKEDSLKKLYNLGS